jgi:hypothetical protein
MGFIFNFQMELSQTVSFEEQLYQMVSLGLYEPIETLIMNQPYVVIHVDIGVQDIFLLLGYNFIDETIIIRLPNSLHVGFRRLIIIKRLNNVNTYFIEYIGERGSGDPILQAYGSGFGTYV